MGRMRDAYMRRSKIARSNNVREILREFGTLRAAHEWLLTEEFWHELADRYEGELERLEAEPESHRQWRADQVTEGMPRPLR